MKLSYWKKGVFVRSRAPPTQKIIKISWCKKVCLVLRFHNRAPLYIPIFNLERVIIKKLEKSRLFSSLFCPILAKSQRCLLNFAKLFYRFSSKTFFKRKLRFQGTRKWSSVYCSYHWMSVSGKIISATPKLGFLYGAALKILHMQELTYSDGWMPPQDPGSTFRDTSFKGVIWISAYFSLWIFIAATTWKPASIR